jgi:RNase P/RNase MRP subunit p29
LIEEIALMGAENIATLSISERAKRALLAEAIEDRIFRLTEELEVMVGLDGSVVDEGNRETVMETARTVKELQQQYAELVSGGPSSVLTAMNSLGDSMKSD